MKKEFLGEFVGTFILVLFGCGAVAAAVLFNAFSSLFEVALMWGIGVTIAIFSSRNLSPAHLNPAVSIAMVLTQKLEKRKLPYYLLSQFIGAFSAATMLFFIFHSAISEFESANHIIRGTSGSEQTAMMFGEFFPNPGFKDKFTITWMEALFLEAFGTFILITVIFSVSDNIKQPEVPPILIGLTITILICLIAPFTQAGFNPARDFAPRLFSYLAGWKEVAIPNIQIIMVYVLGPILGGVCGAFVYNTLHKKMLKFQD